MAGDLDSVLERRENRRKSRRFYERNRLTNLIIVLPAPPRARSAAPEERAQQIRALGRKQELTGKPMAANPLRGLLRYLSSLWGILSTASILFPGAAALLQAKLAPEHSQLSIYYGVLPSIFAAFALLLLTTFRAELASIRFARKVGIGFFIAGVMFLFAFLYVKQEYVDINEREPPHWNGPRVTTIDRSKGQRMTLTVDTAAGGKEIRTEGGDPRDVGLLSLFVAAFGALTVGFGSLGIHSYENEIAKSS